MRIASLLLILLVSLIAGCGSTPDDWRDMSESEISNWKGLGLDAEKAQTWKAAGFSPATASSWLTESFDLETASKWSDEQFTAEETKKWLQGGFDLDDAKDNRTKGLSPTSKDEESALEMNTCAEPRGDVCPQNFDPVCAAKQDGSKATYPNDCTACADTDVVAWVEGKCP